MLDVLFKCRVPFKVFWF